jgi:hypothetical protein
MKLKGLTDKSISRIADMFEVPYSKSYRNKLSDLEAYQPADEELVDLAEVLYLCIEDEDVWVPQVSNSRLPTRSDNNVESVRFYMNTAADDMGRGLNWLGALAKIWALHSATGYTQAIDELHERCCCEEVGETYTSRKKEGAEKLTETDIKDANAAGLRHVDTDIYWSYHTPTLETAYVLGREYGLSLEGAPVVTGQRFGKPPESGISRNHADDTAELGLSLAGLGDEIEYGLWSGAMGKELVTVTGVLVPETGSDGEPLILMTGLENFD